MPEVNCGWDTCKYNNPETDCECPDAVTLSNCNVEHITPDGDAESTELLFCENYEAGDAT